MNTTMKKTTSPELLPLQNHFAETLRETLEEGELAQIRVAEACGIPPSHLTQMKQGKRRCTPEYDLRLSKFYGITPGFFLRLQMSYEIERAARENGQQLSAIRPLHPVS
jgi:addiction module HigA family antidote